MKAALLPNKPAAGLLPNRAPVTSTHLHDIAGAPPLRHQPRRCRVEARWGEFLAHPSPDNPAAQDVGAPQRDPSPEQIGSRPDRSADALNPAAGTGWGRRPSGGPATPR